VIQLNLFSTESPTWSVTFDRAGLPKDCLAGDLKDTRMLGLGTGVEQYLKFL